MLSTNLPQRTTPDSATKPANADSLDWIEVCPLRFSSPHNRLPRYLDIRWVGLLFAFNLFAFTEGKMLTPKDWNGGTERQREMSILVQSTFHVQFYWTNGHGGTSRQCCLTPLQMLRYGTDAVMSKSIQRLLNWSVPL